MPEKIGAGLPNFRTPGRCRPPGETGLVGRPEKGLDDLTLEFLVRGRGVEDFPGELEDVDDAGEAEAVKQPQRRRQELHHLGLKKIGSSGFLIKSFPVRRFLKKWG